METSKRTTNIILFLVIILLFSTVSFAAANTAFLVSDKIYQGISIAGVPLGGLSIADAKTKMETAFKQAASPAPLVYEHDGQQWTVKAEDIDLALDAETLARQAYEIGRTGNVFQNLKERYLTINQGRELPLIVHYDRNKLEAILRAIAHELDIPAQNASLSFRGAKPVLNSETIGRKVDIEQTIAETQSHFQHQLAVRQALVQKEMIPPVRTRDLETIDGILASFTTQFSEADQNRTENIIIAARSLDGVLVKAADVFSFNQTVGPRLSQYGFKEAPVYIDGELTPDWGGGVCQVSTTLYNAALLADMEIVERTSHPRAASYVPLGQDATVADNLLDFKFKNTTGSNIYITSIIGSGQVTVRIYGHTDPRQPEIEILNSDQKVIEPNTVIKQDPDLEVGKQIVEAEGQKGFVVNTYRLKRINNQVIARELLSTDEYTPKDKIVRVGTKAPPAQPNK